MTRYRAGNGFLNNDTEGRIIDRVDCPTCGAARGWPCTPLRDTGHATVLRPHPARARAAR